MGASHVVRLNGSYAAGLLTGTFFLRYGIVRTDGLALSALDAFILIYVGFPPYHGNRVFGADLYTGVGKAALAHVADLVPSFLAGLAGRRNDLHKRGLVIFVGYIAGFHASGQMHRLILRAQRQSHGKSETLAHDRAGTVDAFSVFLGLFIYHLIWNGFHIVIQRVSVGFKSKPCHFLEYSSS